MITLILFYMSKNFKNNLKNNEEGITHIILIVVVIAIIAIIGFAIYRVAESNKTKNNNQAPTQSAQEKASLDTSSNIKKNTETTKPKEPDSPDTLSNPNKVTSPDGKTYFVYGAPAGQNNKTTKKIIISLPGHGTTADDGYKAWKGHIESGQYALAEFNWWKGTGEKTTDYYQPADVIMQVRGFLDKQGYKSNDAVILHGFSRGSANTYAVVAQDHLKGAPVIDAVISNAGKYQSDFPLTDKKLSETEITNFFQGIPWVLACGGKDENPNRDGCPGMRETKTFLEAHKANVLAILEDPNSGHGAFHMSKLKLPEQAFTLIDKALGLN